MLPWVSHTHKTKHWLGKKYLCQVAFAQVVENLTVELDDTGSNSAFLHLSSFTFDNSSFRQSTPAKFFLLSKCLLCRPVFASFLSLYFLLEWLSILFKKGRFFLKKASNNVMVYFFGVLIFFNECCSLLVVNLMKNFHLILLNTKILTWKSWYYFGVK